MPLHGITHVSEAPTSKKKASGPNVEFLENPEFIGPWQYIKTYSKLKLIAEKYCSQFDCAIFRLPGATANLICRLFNKTRKPFAVELVIDPWENFAPGVIKSFLGPLIRVTWTLFVKQMCRKAVGVSYVTKDYLQKRYPCAYMIDKRRVNAFTGHYSSVELEDNSFGQPRHYKGICKRTIAHVANSYNDDCKGHIPLLHAIQIVRSHEIDVEAVFVGDGPKKAQFQRLAEELGIFEHVRFTGRLPDSNEVRNVIREADLFVFPTRAEGLPRVLLEAMAEGLPCISSPTCGVPEVIREEFLCEYDDWNGLANKIEYMLKNPAIMERESSVNLQTVHEYAASILNPRRKEFYDSLKNVVTLNIKE